MPCSKGLINVVILGTAFSLLFTAFGATQNLETSLNGKIGGRAMGILYIFFALGNFLLASPTVALLGERASLFMAALTYLLFVFTNFFTSVGTAEDPITPTPSAIHNHTSVGNLLASSAKLMTLTHEYMLYGAGAIAGIGASILWTAQGSFISKWATSETMGLFNGVFFGIFYISFVAGSLIAAFVLMATTPKTLFLIFTVLGAVACSMFYFLSKPPSKEDEAQTAKDAETPWYYGLLSMAKTNIKSPALLLLNVVFFYSGLSEAFFYGIFTNHASITFSEYYQDHHPDASKAKLASMGTMWMSLIMAGFGVAAPLSSFLLGWLSDRIGRIPVVAASTIAAFSGFGLMWYNCAGSSANGFNQMHNPEELSIVLWWVVVSLFAFSDSGFNTQIYAFIGELFAHTGSASLGGAFATLKFTQSCGYAVAFFYPPTPGNLHYELMVVGGVAALAGISFIVTISFSAGEIQRHKNECKMSRARSTSFPPVLGYDPTHNYSDDDDCTPAPPTDKSRLLGNVQV